MLRNDIATTEVRRPIQRRVVIAVLALMYFGSSMIKARSQAGVLLNEN